MREYFEKNRLKTMAVMVSLIMCLTVMLPFLKLVVLADSVTGTMRMSDKTYACNISDGRGMNAKYIEEANGNYIPVYCIEQGKRINSGDIMTRQEINDTELGIAYICGYNTFNGWGSRDADSLIKSPSTNNGNFIKYAATQIVIWEIAEGKDRHSLTSSNSEIQSAIDELYGRIDKYKEYIKNFPTTKTNNFGLYLDRNEAISKAYPSTENTGVNKEVLENFIVNLYKGFLGREASMQDKQLYMDAITSGSLTAQDLLNSIYNSQEAINYRTGGTAWSTIINGFYLAFYGVNGTASDVNAWVNRLQTEGLLWNDVFNSFNGSSGWANRKTTLNVMGDVTFLYRYNYPSSYNPTNATYSRSPEGKAIDHFTIKGTDTVVLSWTEGFNLTGNGILDKVYKWYDGTDEKQQATISATVKNINYYAAFSGSASVVVLPTPTDTPTPTTPPPPPPALEDCFVSFELEKIDPNGNSCRGATFGIYDDAACTQVAKNRKSNLTAAFTDLNNAGIYKTNSVDIQLQYNPATTTSVTRTVYIKETKAPTEFSYNGSWLTGSFKQDTNIYKVVLTYYPDKNGGNGKLEYKIYRVSDNSLINPSIDANTIFNYDPRGVGSLNISNLYNLGLDNNNTKDDYGFVNERTQFSLDKVLSNTTSVTGSNLSGFKFELLNSTKTVIATGTTNSSGKTIWTTNYPTNDSKTVIYNLPIGDYTIREIMPTDRVFTYNKVNTTIPYTFTISDTSFKQVQNGVWEKQISITTDNFSNNYASIKSVGNSIEHGDLSITKNLLITNELSEDKTFEFTVYYRGNGNTAGARDNSKKFTVNVVVPKGSKSNTVTIKDLPVGWYEIEEVNPEGYILNYDTETLTRITNGKTFTFSVTNSIPDLKTTLKDTVTDDHVIAQEEIINLIDTVNYSNLIIGKEYTVTGVLMDKDTGKELKDSEGNLITSSKTFVADKSNGSIDIEFTFDGSLLDQTSTIVAFEDLLHEGKTYCTHADINDEAQTVRFPDIHTTFIDKDTNDRFVKVSENEELVDTVTFTNLVPGLTYTVEGTLMIKETGEALKDSEGNIITSSRTFVPTTSSGTVDVVFTIDTSKLENKTLVAFETLYFNDIVIKTHADINDMDQTVYVPEIKTTLVDKVTDNHVVAENTNITLVDKVTYSNLVVGKTYVMYGTLMNKDTNDVVKDSEGNPITSSVEFTPTTPSGTVDVIFTFNSSSVASGSTLVAFEEIRYEDITFATHTDIEDLPQTVYFPDIHTTFIDSATNNQVAASNSKATLIDTVTYENLTVGLTYTITGTLVIKETGEALKDSEGNVITVKKTFVANTPNGTVDVAFIVDTSLVEGLTLVAFETLYYNDIVIKTHADINDVDQTIYIPEIKTTLVDKATNDHVVSLGTNVTLVDSVSYNNLVVGKEYTISGTIMVKETGDALKDSEGNVITASKTFTAPSTSGIITVEFTIDSTLIPKTTLVAFESLSFEGVTVAVHSDINDVDQTVYVPSIKTTLVSKDTDSHIAPCDTDITLIDTVTYSNLVTGKEYKLTGTLMVKETGKALTDVNGNVITVSKNFTPKTTSGSVEIEFIIDSSLIPNTTLVAFEEMSYEGLTVAIHSDINDIDQTVYVPEIKTTLKDKSTSDKTVAYGEDIVLVDTVNYSNLVVGKEYTISGTIMVKETGEALLDSEGNPITASKKFTASSKNGSIDIEFTIDSTLIPNTTLVAFEEMAYNGLTIAVHSDINDIDQTVYVPSLRTHAYEEGLNSNHIQAVEDVIITDTVTYSNLVVGKTYTVTGTLHYKDSAETVKDSEGNPITAGITFVATTSNGSVEVKFTVNGELLKGKTIVVFEDVYYEDVLVGIHADINDESQTIYFPEITTAASVSGKSTFEPKDEIELTDIITYKNLQPGVTYVVVGTLMNSDGTEFKVNGKTITSEVKFVPTETNGSVTVTFKFNAKNLANGKAIVCFEELYAEGMFSGDGSTVSRVLIATHKDIKDANQTVKVAYTPITTRTGETVNFYRIGEAICLIGIAISIVIISLKKKRYNINK